MSFLAFSSAINALGSSAVTFGFLLLTTLAAAFHVNFIQSDTGNKFLTHAFDISLRRFAGGRMTSSVDVRRRSGLCWLSGMREFRLTLVVTEHKSCSQLGVEGISTLPGCGVTLVGISPKPCVAEGLPDTTIRTALQYIFTGAFQQELQHISRVFIFPLY